LRAHQEEQHREQREHARRGPLGPLHQAQHEQHRAEEHADCRDGAAEQEQEPQRRDRKAREQVELQREQPGQRVVAGPAAARRVRHRDLDRVHCVQHRERRDEGVVLAALDHRSDDAAVVAAQHAAEVLERDARETPHHAVDQPRGGLAEPGVVALLSPGVDQVVAGPEGLDQLGQLLRRVLQVGVERDDPVAQSRLEARHHRGVLPEIAREAHDAQRRAGVLLLAQQRERAVGAAVVHDDDLRDEPLRGGQPVEHGEQPLEEGRDVAGLVEHRDHDREARSGRRLRGRGHPAAPPALAARTRAAPALDRRCASITRRAAATTSATSARVMSG
jgi:hypothetical protein